MRLARVASGCVAAMAGLVVVAVSVAAILDPVATKHADDADPFGASTWSAGLGPLAGGLILLWVGWRLLRPKPERQDRA